MSKAQHTPGMMVVDSNTDDMPFRVYSQTTQSNVGYFFARHDAELFAAAHELLAEMEKFVNICEYCAPIDFIRLIGECYITAKAAVAKAKGE